MKMSRWINEKRGIVDSYLPWLLIALAVLAVVMITISLLRSEGSGLISDLKDMFKFGLVAISSRFNLSGCFYNCFSKSWNGKSDMSQKSKISAYNATFPEVGIFHRAKKSRISATCPLFQLNEEKNRSWPVFQ